MDAKMYFLWGEDENGEHCDVFVQATSVGLAKKLADEYYKGECLDDPEFKFDWSIVEAPVVTDPNVSMAHYWNELLYEEETGEAK
jgi:hypothetical protein